jgi:hypothetical protein
LLIQRQLAGVEECETGGGESSKKERRAKPPSKLELAKMLGMYLLFVLSLFDLSNFLFPVLLTGR